MNIVTRYGTWKVPWLVILLSDHYNIFRLRKELALAIGETEFPEYPKNILKYSRNMEISKILTIPYFNKTFGGSIESNIIFNPNALMPKSVMLKYAVNAMGKEWELIEVSSVTLFRSLLFYYYDIAIVKPPVLYASIS